MIGINLIFLLSITYIACILGTIQYRRFAIKRNILANINFRTLHETPIPRGGGIVFSSVFIVSVMLLWKLNKLPDDLFFVLVVGGTIAIAFGFLDDMFELSAKKTYWPVSSKFLVAVLVQRWATH